MERLTTYFYHNGNSLDIVFERVTTAYYTEYLINGNKVTRMEYVTRYNRFMSNNDYKSVVYKERR